MFNSLKLFLLCIALSLSACTTHQSSDSQHSHDSDSAATADTLPYITHGNEIGTVETPTVAPKKFVDNAVTEMQHPPLEIARTLQGYPLKRAIYLDHAERVYADVAARNEFAKYCKDNGFDEVHLYHFIDIVQSSANFKNFSDFMRLLYDNGVVKRIAVLGSSSTQSFESYWKYTPDTTRKPNGINYEAEFWNGVITYTDWLNSLATLDAYCDSKSPHLYNSFYMGWFKNLGSLSDSAAARQMIQEVDYIDLHDYQTSTVSYTYGSSRYEADAKGAKSQNRIITIDPIFSTEQKDWGAQYDFDGYYLKSLGYAGIEKKFIDDFNTHASTLVKQYVRIGKFKYFIKRYNYFAIPPKP